MDSAKSFSNDDDETESKRRRNLSSDSDKIGLVEENETNGVERVEDVSKRAVQEFIELIDTSSSSSSQANNSHESSQPNDESSESSHEKTSSTLTAAAAGAATGSTSSETSQPTVLKKRKLNKADNDRENQNPIFSRSTNAVRTVGTDGATATNNSASFSVAELIRRHRLFRTSSLAVKCDITKLYLPNLNDTYLLISTLLSDKIYQLHNEHNHQVSVMYDEALNLINNNVTKLSGYDHTLEDIWDLLLKSIPLNVRACISFAKEIPGLNSLNQHDFVKLVNNRLFDFFLIKHARLFIRDQSYLVFTNKVYYTKEWMIQVIGKEMVDAMFKFSNSFNALNLTPKEIALIFPYIFTLDGKYG